MPGMSIQDFATKIRTKFPGAYDKIPDQDLVTKFVQKFPQYTTMLTDSPSAGVPQELQGAPEGLIHAPSDPAASIAGHVAELPDFGIGAAKGVGHTAYGAGALVNHTLQGDPLKGIDYPPEVTPSNEAQRAGMMGEQMGEMFLPGAVAKYADKLPLISKLPGIVRAGIGAATEGAGTGLLTKAQTGDTGQAEIGTALGAATPLVSKIAESVAPSLVNRVLRPRGKELSFGRNPGQGIVDEGIMAPTMGSLQNKVQKSMNTIGPQIDSAVAPYKNTADVDYIRQPVGDAMIKANALPDTNAGLINELSGFNRDLIRQPLNAMTPSDMLGLKRNIAASTRWTGSGYDNVVNQPKVSAFGGLSDKINEMVPEVAPLNDRYSNLVGAHQALDRDLSKAAPMSPWLELGGAGAGLFSGLTSGNDGSGPSYNPVKGMLGSAGLAALGGLISRNPGVATVGAQMMRRAPAIMEAGKNLGLGGMNTPGVPVRMKAPNGQQFDMPPEKVDEALSKGWTN